MASRILVMVRDSVEGMVDSLRFFFREFGEILRLRGEYTGYIQMMEEQCIRLASRKAELEEQIETEDRWYLRYSLKYVDDLKKTCERDLAMAKDEIAEHMKKESKRRSGLYMESSE